MQTAAFNTNLLSLINMFLLLAVTIGGFFAFRSGRHTAIIKFQDDTIKALQDRLTVIESNQDDLKKENAVLHHTIETIQMALKQRGIIITIDGDMIIIQDDTGKSSYQKRKQTNALASASGTPSPSSQSPPSKRPRSSSKRSTPAGPVPGTPDMSDGIHP